jgi:uncharacterized protein
MPRAVRASDVTPQPWRNGGGRTRELFAWPAGSDWKLRISLADIDADGPFSAFAGVQRWFAVVSGAGVVLALPTQGDRRLTIADEPLAFDGAAAPDCHLIDGSTRDLNLMLRGGLEGRMQRAVSGQAWREAWTWRACFVTAPARWVGPGNGALDLEGGTLLVDLPPGSCRLESQEADATMFWLGASVSPR